MVIHNGERCVILDASPRGGPQQSTNSGTHIYCRIIPPKNTNFGEDRQKFHIRIALCMLSFDKKLRKLSSKKMSANMKRLIEKL